MALMKRWKNAQQSEKRFKFRFTRRTEEAYKPISLSDSFSLDPDFFEGKRVLEVGCGPLSRIHQLHEASSKVGLDPLVIDVKNLFPPGANLVQGVGEHLPFADQAFEAVLCINTLDHVFDPILLLEEMRRVLRNDGTLLLFSNTFDAAPLLRRVLDYIDRSHPFHFEDSELFELIESVGLTISHYESSKIQTQAFLKPLPVTRLPSSLVKFLIAAAVFGLHRSHYVSTKLES